MNTQDKEILQNWFLINRITTGTQKTYTRVLNLYSKAIGKTITEIQEEAYTEEDNQVPRHRRKVRVYYPKFIKYLEDQNYTENTKSSYVYIINSFYTYLDINVPKMKTNYKNKPLPENVDKTLPKEIIRKMIQNANLRDKAILSFMAHTGQAQNEVKHLTIKQILDAINHETNLYLTSTSELYQHKQEALEPEAYKLNMFRQKTRHHYWTYMPRITMNYIIDYLYERDHAKQEKQKTQGINDYVFKTKYGQPMKRDSVGKVCRTIGEKCGFENPEELDNNLRKLLEHQPKRHRVWKSHNFRKYFLNTCRKYAGSREENMESFTGSELGDFWIGHEPSTSITSYIQYNSEDDRIMKEHYLQVLPYLLVETKLQTIESENLKEFKKMKKNYNKLIEENKDIKKELKIMKEFLGLKEIRQTWSEK